MNDSNAKHGAELSGLVDWWINGWMVSTAIDPIH